MNDQHMSCPPGHLDRFETVRQAALYCERTGERWAIQQGPGGRWWVTVEVRANRPCRHALIGPGDDLEQTLRAVRALGRRSLLGLAS